MYTVEILRLDTLEAGITHQSGDYVKAMKMANFNALVYAEIPSIVVVLLDDMIIRQYKDGKSYTWGMEEIVHTMPLIYCPNCGYGDHTGARGCVCPSCGHELVRAE